ncbi:MAG: phosphatase PAP2 family protein [Terriglobales bacterium]
MSENHHLFFLINNFARHTPGLHTVMAAYATGGAAVFGALLVAGWWLARRSGDPAEIARALWAATCVPVSLAVNQPIVSLEHVRRPFTVAPHSLLLIRHAADYGFPSDHAVMAGAVAAGLFTIHRWLGVTALGAALFMAFARVYVGVHWPADVAAGLAVGAIVTLALGIGAVPLLRRVAEWLLGTRLRPVLQANGAGKSSKHSPDAELVSESAAV